MAPTRGPDTEKGEVHVVVSRFSSRRAKELTSSVLGGERSLPAVSPVEGPLLWVAAGIVVGVLVLILAAVVSAG